MPSLTAIVLAAGQGTRMKSRLPKVLHTVAGRPLLYYPLKAAFDAGAEHAVIVSSGRSEIQAELERYFPKEKLSIAVQEVARGTGDAVRIGLEQVKSERVLIVCGDTPLVRSVDLTPLVAVLDGPEQPLVSLLTCELEDPQGYGRILRDAQGRVVAVREHKDLANDAERAVREVNAGMYAASTAALRDAVARIVPNNAQGEYYLTDVVHLVGSGRAVSVLGHREALVGVNDRSQLHAAETTMFQRIRERHARAGVSVRGDVYIDEGVELGEDVVLEVGVRLRGETRIGRGTLVDVGSVLDDVVVGENVVIKPYSIMTRSEVGRAAQIGPFSHLRPDSEIGEEAHIGNFVETKKTRVQKGAKANHLAYLGDGDVGPGANVGAGTIFCNYDGFSKHRTVIGEGAFIGSDSQLVAPLAIGKGAYVGTGTTVTQDVPDDALAIGRARQENKLGYASKLRARLKAARDAKK
ncbi:MAG: bifunctional UDP-N-acetylglucosamine diphosphorylase/glucosamine-1-phosphate N-acetyltransferase GlmU [Polyangiaceae bacterium]